VGGGKRIGSREWLLTMWICGAGSEIKGSPRLEFREELEGMEAGKEWRGTGADTRLGVEDLGIVLKLWKKWKLFLFLIDCLFGLLTQDFRLVCLTQDFRLVCVTQDLRWKWTFWIGFDRFYPATV
jgi:hypothetical protein